MQATWQIQTAKNRFSEVVDAALTQGAQIVTRHGKPVVRVVALSEAQQQSDQRDDPLVDFLLAAPRGDGIELAPRNRRAPVTFD
jgi:antitoxin Phd